MDKFCINVKLVMNTCVLFFYIYICGENQNVFTFKI